ncbi:MAG: hypothetical protein ACYSTI_13210 [Planctomycetota bacterium]|jgi:hypothetical protein
MTSEDKKLIVDRVNELIDEYFLIETEIKNLKEYYSQGYRYLDSTTGEVIKEADNVVHMSDYRQ